jgi:phage tail-like protein
MSVERANPYGSFNFLVNLGNGDAMSVRAGFQEVSGLSIDVTIAEYRNGNDAVNHVRKIDAMYKVGDVTLRRGLIGALDLFQWIDQTRTGDPTARRNITIQLRDEAGLNTVMTWRLINARPMKYTGPSLNAKTGSDVAIEELVLSCEDMTIE